MSERKHIVGFGTYQAPAPPPERETKVNYVELALAEYLRQRKPYDPDDDHESEFKTSREIQEDLANMVTTSISTITEYMHNHGYQMVNVGGGGLAWHIQVDLPF